MSTSAVYQIKITIAGIEAPIWRRLLVSSTTSLNKLDRILRIALGWPHWTPYQFHAVNPDGNLDIWQNLEAPLSDLLRTPGQRIGYMYDTNGRDWPHTLELEAIQEPNPLLQVPACLGGARACPPDACLGFWHYPSVLLAIRESPEAARPYDGFDPEAFSLNQVNQRLQRKCVHVLRRLDWPTRYAEQPEERSLAAASSERDGTPRRHLVLMRKAVG